MNYWNVKIVTQIYYNQALFKVKIYNINFISGETNYENN